MILYLKKYSIFILAIILISSIIVGCSDKQSDGYNTIAYNNFLVEKYSLESNCIEIYFLDNPEPIVITDTKDIDLLKKTVQFINWEYIDPRSGDTYQGIENIFVKFNDDTTVAMYDDIPYGLLGQGSPDELGNISNIDAYYTFPQEFLDTVLQMIEKYSK